MHSPSQDESADTREGVDARQGGHVEGKYVEEREEGAHEREGHGADPDPADKSRGME